MALITPDYVKDRFPNWRTYCEAAAVGDRTPDDVLTQQIEDAEVQLVEYVIVDEDSMTPQLKRHLLTLVKKSCFDLKHGNATFDNPPQLVKDYQDTIEMLERYRDGEFPSPGDDPDTADDFRVTAKPRRFDQWFT